MVLPASSDNRLIRDESFEDLKDITTIEDSVIERAKQNNLEAINDIGREYSRLNMHDKAIEWLGTSAAMGFHQSELELGHLFFKVNGSTALEWYHKARNNGIKSATCYIAMIAFEQKRYKHAMDYFKESAENGDPNGQFRVALGYYNRWGLNGNTIDDSTNTRVASSVGTNQKLAMDWFLKSEKQGHGEAAYYIGRMYENGHGVLVDYYQALDWYHKSKARGYKPADESIDNLHKRGYIHIPKDKIIAYHEKNKQ